MTSSYIPKSVRERVIQTAGNRCGFCLSRGDLILGLVEIEHLQPSAAGGSDDEENLWLACRRCNSNKADKTHGRDPVSQQVVALFNPRTQIWTEHFHWSEDGCFVLGQTAIGRATVVALKLNDTPYVEQRRLWTSVGWHPPTN